MYRIIKLLNNNVAIVKTQDQAQAVVMGTGITFQKKKGDLIAPDKIEKVFTLKNEESQNNFSALLKDIPLDFITTSYEIIETAIQKYNYPVQEYLYVTLTDHIFLAYQNFTKGTYENSKLPDMGQEYEVERQIGKEALGIIRKRLDIQLPDEEVGRIALHFINAKGSTIQQDDSVAMARRITEMVQTELAASGIVRNRKNQNYYDRLMIHLNYFLERISDKEDEKDLFSLNFEENIKHDYPESYEIADRIYHRINEEVGKQLNTSERVYFTIHIQRLL